MKKNSNLFIAGLAGALLLAGGACSSTSGDKTGTGGSTGNGGAGGSVIPPGYIPLPSTSTGFVQDLTGGSNIIGPWYSYGDSVGANASVTNGDDHANSDCVKKGGFDLSVCSKIAFPLPGQPFPPSDAATSKMCTDGVAAMVMSKGGSPDYTDLWGGGISLDLNNPGGDAGVKGDIDLSAYKGIAFDFSAFTGIDPAEPPTARTPPSTMRVNFPFTGETTAPTHRTGWAPSRCRLLSRRPRCTSRSPGPTSAVRFT